MHIKYPKIRRLWTEETQGILNWKCIIQEKIDWANASVRLEDWLLCIWSRTRLLCKWDDIHNNFNWLVNYVKSHLWILELLEKNPTYRLYWEWLVQHSIRYSPEHYNHFRLYDILLEWDEEQPVFMNPVDVFNMAHSYGINRPNIYAVMENPTIDELQEYMNKPNLWDKQEGIVIKNMDFVNKFCRPQYAKLVNESFKEENKIIFWNSNRFDELEQQRALKFTTPWRFLKIVHKIEQDKQSKFNEKNIWEIIWRCQYDVISEEIPWVVKNDIVNYWKLRKNISNIVRTMALQYIEQWEDAPVFTFNKNRDEK